MKRRKLAASLRFSSQNIGPETAIPIPRIALFPRNLWH